MDQLDSEVHRFCIAEMMAAHPEGGNFLTR